MARIKLTLPDHCDFETQLTVRISEINYGGHLGNDAVLSLAHEARVQFFNSLGYTEFDVAGSGIVLADAVVVYRAEAFHGNTLTARLAADDFNPYGFDLFYQLTNAADGREVARIKTGIVFFNYTARAIAPIPAPFLASLGRTPSTEETPA